MTHLEAHEGVTRAAVSVAKIVTSTGRETARLHLSIHPGEVILALVEGKSLPAFHWCGGPVCGSVSTAGWIVAERSDERYVCQTCQSRWETLADLYLRYAEPLSGRNRLR